jgi:UPF0755 protein
MAGGICIFILYGYFFRPNVVSGDHSYTFLCIPTGSRFDDVCRILESKNVLKNKTTFEWVSRRMKYPDKVKPGRYRIKDGISNYRLVSLLRSGRQEPVRLTFMNIRTLEEFAGKISRQIEADSLSLLSLLRDPFYLKQYDVDPANSFVLFIPNTYEFFWNTSAKGFMSRMAMEKEKFWNSTRMQKCRAAGLSVAQVVTLASIVEKETNKDPEKPVIAGVYLNRLRHGWPLQADPTIIFAWNDYRIKRVTGYHLKIQSPYNTYIYKGLPPGPVCLPSISSIDAVLDFQNHHYYYFCAKYDLSGYHVFAETLEEHNRNAKKYQAAIKKQGIF